MLQLLCIVYSTPRRTFHELPLTLNKQKDRTELILLNKQEKYVVFSKWLLNTSVPFGNIYLNIGRWRNKDLTMQHMQSIHFAPYKGEERVTGPLSRAKVLYNWTMFLHWIWIIGNLDCQWEADVKLCKYAIVNLCKYSQLRAHSIVRLIIVVWSLISPHKGSTSLESEQKHLLHLLS